MLTGWRAHPFTPARGAATSTIAPSSIEQALRVRVTSQEYDSDHYTTDQDALLLQPKSSQGVVFENDSYNNNNNGKYWC